MYMLYENKYIYDLQGGSGGGGTIPPEAEENLKNQAKWRLSLYFYFLLFGRAP